MHRLFKIFISKKEARHQSWLSTMSHDLKTPLACIIGSLETYDYAKERLTEENKNILLQTALQEARRLDVLISEFLSKIA